MRAKKCWLSSFKNTLAPIVSPMSITEVAARMPGCIIICHTFTVLMTTGEFTFFVYIFSNWL